MKVPQRELFYISILVFHSIVFFDIFQTGGTTMKLNHLFKIALSSIMIAGCSSSTVSTTPSVTSSNHPDPVYSLLGTVDSATVSVEDGETQAYGYAGETMHTAFFDYSINDAGLYESYESYEAGDDKYILVVNVTISNPYDYEVTMFDTDFVAIWYENDGYTMPDDDDNIQYPVTADEGAVSGKMLESEYTIAAGKSVTGELVYYVARDYYYFSLAYMEEYNDGTTGNTFFLDFEVE